MRQKRWRPRYKIGLKVVLATLGLAGGVYAADQITAPPADDIGKLITEQRVTDGQLVAKPADEHQREKLTPAQMLELGAKYSEEMKDTLEHAEAARSDAYRSRDIIRMTCVEDKLSQMKAVYNIAEPRGADLKDLLGDEIVMQQHFSIVRQGRERVAELALELADCSGDNPPAAMYIPNTAATPPPPSEATAVDDPLRPPSPSQPIDRPPEASVYR